ncbi:NAD(P)H-dependent oxidoreductase [Actinoplanes sp. NPDC049668]|uniref:NAD(P)H-dependent oxidoreductase n=1 Tax=unclassified Actinoplanes TaxID=2626549 RepID=UPI0033B7E0DE
MAQVHIVYAHPSATSFTREVLDAFTGGLRDAGHTSTLSDLYAMGFRGELSAQEYERESAYRAGAPLPDDVAAEHARLGAADVWAFIYPVWWADCPALLKGWFDRVWTVGFAYQPMSVRPARRALIVCTAGYSVAELEASGCYAAMRTTMLEDRIGARAESAELHVLGGRITSAGTGTGDWAAARAGHLRRVTELARSIA